MTDKRDLEVGDAFITSAVGGIASAWIIAYYKKDSLTKGIYIFALGGASTIEMNRVADYETSLALSGRAKSEYHNVNNAKRLSLLFEMIFNEEVTIREGR